MNFIDNVPITGYIDNSIIRKYYPIRCSSCDGVGNFGKWFWKEKCTKCNGDGLIVIQNPDWDRKA